MNYSPRISSLESQHIRNGAMEIAQRYPYPTVLAATGATYLCDRFAYNKGGTMLHSLSQALDAPSITQAGFGLRYSFLADCTTAQASLGAGDVALMYYNMEGYDFARLHSKKCYLTFWVKATKVGIYCVAFKDAVESRSFVSEYTVNTTNTWEQKTIPITFNDYLGTYNYNSSAGLIISWVMACGTAYQTATKDQWVAGNRVATANQVNSCDSTANNFQITGVQLIQSDSSDIGFPAFHRMGGSFDEELKLCQRYCQVTWKETASATIAYGFAVNTTAVNVNVPYKTIMRTTPVLRYSSLSDVVWSNGSAAVAVGNLSLVLSTSSSATLVGTATVVNNAGYRLEFATGSADQTKYVGFECDF